MKLKYVIAPDYGRSNTDGQLHWISAAQLMHLYGVNPRECVVLRRGMPHMTFGGLILLTPRMDGNYTTPSPPKGTP